ncbi:MAG TPA: hypothetical protein PLL06_15895 [Acidobacteriota bacterium]|nr:hypothetical protein [Acidobacteriota bacterium]HND19431.1 hypothetical protein [Acidobacteriota bacterium]HNG93874.1 hypothetical protein [Acidobacteriota bacterium]HNH81882.1 hypothetical protein [Acidobacteriota bacterium]HNJ39340.1 hypothetical protein [Acidobacteriota bacterium]
MSKKAYFEIDFQNRANYAGHRPALSTTLLIFFHRNQLYHTVISLNSSSLANLLPLLNNPGQNAKIIASDGQPANQLKNLGVPETLNPEPCPSLVL